MTSISNPDAVVVGSGMAGLTTALHILDRGGRVVILEKEKKTGGNSMKASSGINAAAPQDGPEEIESFIQDTLKSAGDHANRELIETLVKESTSALQWLRDRVGVNLLEHRTQLGGHSHSRTFRPAKGAVGFTIMSALQKELKPFEETKHLETKLSTRLTDLIVKDGQVCGVRCVTTDEEGTETSVEIEAPHIVLATGGFAADRGHDSLLAKYRSEYLHFPSTFGDFSTGDVVKIASSSVGASSCLMDKVQVHPTGFVDPADPSAKTKFLCAELMRGIGGILVNPKGKRFCNELGTRSYVTEEVFQHDPNYAATGKLDPTCPLPTFTLILSAKAAAEGGEHIGFYSFKQLMKPYRGIDELAKFVGVSKETVEETIQEYCQHALSGSDPYGKTSFSNLFSDTLEEEVFYAGRVTPVLHYTMGGLTTDKEGRVLNAQQDVIGGLFAVGEVSGGLHGDNRLAGNSLLECVVFGTIIGRKISIL